jgi:hypothetical protein
MFGNWVRELTATTGTGTVTMTGMSGFARFADAFSVGDLVYYHIMDGNNRESGIGTVGAANTLARTTVLQTLVAGTLTNSPGTGITLSGGSTVTVYADLAAWNVCNLRKGADVASAATTNIWTKDGDVIDVTGTTGITSFGTAARAGQLKYVRFTGALTLTHGANLDIPGGASVTTAAGDFVIVLALTTTSHKIIAMSKLTSAMVTAALGFTPYSNANPSGYISSVSTAAVQSALSGQSLTGDLGAGNNNLTGLKTARFNGEVDLGNSGTGTTTLAFSSGQCQKLTLNGNCTIALSSSFPGVGHYQLRLVQDATGGRSVTWSGFTSTRWGQSATAPAINASANGETVLNFYFDGTNTITTVFKVGEA